MTATAIVSRAFRLKLAVRNGPATFRAKGLPAGLHLDAATGEISGVPIAPRHHAVVVTASNVVDASTAELALVVTIAPN